MKTRAVVAGGFLALAGVWAISAVGQAMLIEPAELPPASYEGREYVDSAGCVFIRAGVDGDVLWVPRVSRDRQPICGQEPTFTAQQLANLKAQEAAAMASVAAPAVADPKPETMEMVESPTRTMVSEPHPNVVNDIYVPNGGAVASASTSYSPSSTSNATNVPGLVVNDIYVGNGATSGVAIPAPTYSPNTYLGGGSTYTPTASLSIGIPNTQGGIPSGYRQAWDDGRINPQRGPRSSSGDASMYQVWTQSVPMQAIASASSGIRSTSNNILNAVIPWRSGKEVAPVSGGSYIQIGAYGNAQNIDAALAVLNGMGMPAALQDGGSVQVVLAGPFGAADLNSALQHLRNYGYADAFVR